MARSQGTPRVDQPERRTRPSEAGHKKLLRLLKLTALLALAVGVIFGLRAWLD